MLLVYSPSRYLKIITKLKFITISVTDCTSICPTYLSFYQYFLHFFYILTDSLATLRQVKTNRTAIKLGFVLSFLLNNNSTPPKFKVRVHATSVVLSSSELCLEKRWKTRKSRVPSYPIAESINNLGILALGSIFFGWI